MTFESVHFVRVIDGDTIIVNIPETPSVFGSMISIRLAGIQCPEIRTTDKMEKHKGLVAKAFTERWCKAKKALKLINVKRGKYFRLIAEVVSDGEILNITLLEKGLAIKRN